MPIIPKIIDTTPDVIQPALHTDLNIRSLAATGCIRLRALIIIDNFLIYLLVD